MRQYRPWYEGGCDALDLAVDVGPENQYDPDPVPDPQNLLRKTVAAHVEFAAMDPEQILIECEEQDEMLGLQKGTTLKMFLDATNSTH